MKPQLLPSILSLAASYYFSGAAAALSTRQLYQFPNLTLIENLAVRPNGQLVLSTMSNGGNLYTLDPHSPQPEVQVAAVFADATGTTGIAQTAPDQFVIMGGYLNQSAFRYVDNKYNVYVLHFNDCHGTTATIRNVFSATGFVNGIAALPGYPDIVLAADSSSGEINRVDVAKGITETVLQDSRLNYTSSSPLPMGVNGIKVYDGHIYFTNSGLQTFGRIPMSADGRTFGDLEIIAKIQAAGSLVTFDDFVIDSHGTTYVGTQWTGLTKISPSGEQVLVVGGDNSTTLLGPTAAALSRDEKRLYITTAGLAFGAPVAGGQIVVVEL
ncbi:hypothetical protein GQ53DRAFT_746174 [Thozetella sp. PMI_491]|nr:hypothetical protein GQ53DRAFT_746174 [Thozetella sp. PMI_491]